MVGRRSLGGAADEDVHCGAENFFYAFGWASEPSSGMPPAVAEKGKTVFLISAGEVKRRWRMSFSLAWRY